MKIPFIEINGEKILLSKITMGIWKDLCKLETEMKKLNEDDIYGHQFIMMKMIVAAFNNPMVTIESIEKYLEIADMLILFEEIRDYIQHSTYEKINLHMLAKKKAKSDKNH